MEEQTLEQKNKQVVESLRKAFEPLTLRLTHETESATIFVPYLMTEPEEPA